MEREVVLLHVIAVPRSDHLWIFRQFYLIMFDVSPVLTTCPGVKVSIFQYIEGSIGRELILYKISIILYLHTSSSCNRTIFGSFGVILG